MGLFSKKRTDTIVAPVSGKMIHLAKVNDPVFSQKLLGDGLAFIPTDGTVVSPINGVVSMVFPTKHAITIKNDYGLDVMLHLGIDTVEMNGDSFNILVREGTKVIAGQKIATMDLDKIKHAGKDSTVMVIITDVHQIKNEISFTEKNILQGEDAFTIIL